MKVSLSVSFRTSNLLGKPAFGNLVIPLRVHEPTGSDEFAAFQSLEQFHYKTFSSDDGETKTQSVGGRKAVRPSLREGK